jgi:hypothetical protein
MKYLIYGILILTLMVVSSLKAVAMQDSSSNPSTDSKTEEKPVGHLNWKTRTFGGQQFWTDLRYAGGWRIQVNSETDHHRLLDPKNVRHAWGNQLHCQQLLDQKIANGEITQASGKVVILLHGLIRTKSSMQTMANYLMKNGDFTTVNFQYASTREKIGEHAAALKSVIDQLGPQVTEISFVCHSLGNIVVRRYLGNNTDEKTGQQGDMRIKRMVMIGPPNQGSRMARILKTSFLFQQIAGVSGMQLARQWEKLDPTLATPAFEFGIVAGGQETDKNFSNFILKGKDDFTVSLDEAKLAGAHDLLVRPLLHSTMMHQPEVMKATQLFLEKGFFESENSRNPIIETPKSSRSNR